MELEVITQLISNLGVPIATCITAVSFIFVQHKSHMKQLSEIRQEARNDREELRQEYQAKVDAFTEAINNNTKVMEKFIEISNRRNLE